MCYRFRHVGPLSTDPHVPGLTLTYRTLKNTIPLTGLKGKTLAEVWDPIPEAYLSMCPPSMPNFFLYQGPNGGPGAGSAVPFLEHQAEYMIKCVEKVQMEFIKSMVVSCVSCLPQIATYH